MASIRCVMIRGGTSRGAYFHARDLPERGVERDELLVRIMGGPDDLQVDGIGGGHPLTSKVAIVSPSDADDADVDYLFLQVDPRRQTVSDAQNCGNLLAGVGTFALTEALVAPSEGETAVRVRMLNTGALCHLVLQTPGGVLSEDGDTRLDGVPGTGCADRLQLPRHLPVRACGVLTADRQRAGRRDWSGGDLCRQRHARSSH